MQMALTKEFLTGVFEGISEDKIEKVLKEYDADVTGLKVNSEKTISENRSFKEKLEKLIGERDTEKSTFQKQIEELEKKLKASGSDDIKNYYEAEKKKVQDMYTVQLSESDKKLASLEAEKNQLYTDYINVLKETEFEKAAEKHGNIDPVKKAILRDVFFARNQFDFTEVDGKKKFIGKDFKSVNDTLQAFLTTDEGKTFILNNNSGGGATGSGASKFSGKNPFAKDTFNVTEQMRLIKENPEKAAALKAAAGA